MNDMTSLVAEIRRELHDVEQEIRGHPYLADLEAGGVRREELSRFAGAQYHIIRSDLRSVALLVPLRSFGGRVVLSGGARRRDGGARSR
jgi:hypothetical protein